ncbi:TRAF-type zinc finger domain-containing protein 1 [Peromyscus eremicus]|uniref:TRAF-type zinc finger domain-containing protein 1 n=1 Tax=Peromyscus eremicus TaxID=42410 RepID=UPI0027DCFEAB|nr:TRAF-type zinc finger domain-containing protein 1 [Peromyscus eremicus]XP_059104783.1 TRAF-type zinc finger domain-containing protein 1 [Peromyscus eremicus]XP_059104784.1 TRAF-type zinc finger domain-containing protein 1 [Peromyscus eremicus]XP_059104785.1 TRAF-type zinc finger domain-containing protein 1 [Peromyscus eremicus]XP_059104786.1 TRAF-type zinc finger domain-containing protein 1 [Peromyscus eremicus]XP_059104787.1 TRAF-type zinc finger domain-containing protein 1 [Peromyscus ere
MAEFPDDQAARLCDNCKKEIPVFNFTIHEIHCQRNIGVCPVCKEPFPKSDMDVHMATEHCQVTCKCNKKLEKRQFKQHMETECPLRLAVCQHCDLELSVLKLKEHEDYCGARTELCGSCGRNVLVKELKTHPQVCGRVEEEKRNEAAIPPDAYDESWSQDGMWIASQLLQQIEALDPPMRLPGRPLRAFESDPFYSRTVSQRNTTAHFPIQNNLFEEQERQERNRSRQSPKESGENNSHLDFMLALSLQNEGQASSMAGQGFWGSVPEADPARGGPSSLGNKKGAADETLLPCEFCEELYPEDLLIDHQTSCNPSHALRSLNTGSSSLRGVEDPGVIFQNFLQQATSNQLDTLMGLNSAAAVEDSVIIPCEFCGVQLEEEVLFHHQDQCDQRPATANHHAMESIPTQDSQPEDASPELPRRRVKHQGDLASGYMDDVKQEAAKGGSTYSPSPSRTMNNMTTCNPVLNSASGPGSECQPSPPRVLKLNNSDSQDIRGRSRGSQNGPAASGHAPVIHSIRNLYPENLAPSFPHGPPGRYGASGRSEGGRSSRVNPTAASYHGRTPKAKPPKQQGAGDAEEEEEE